MSRLDSSSLATWHIACREHSQSFTPSGRADIFAEKQCKMDGRGRTVSKNAGSEYCNSVPVLSVPRGMANIYENGSCRVANGEFSRKIFHRDDLDPKLPISKN
jgi:hypothetical protein